MAVSNLPFLHFGVDLGQPGDLLTYRYVCIHMVTGVGWGGVGGRAVKRVVK